MTPSSLKSSASSPLPRLCNTPASKIGSGRNRSIYIGSGQSQSIGSGSQSDSILSTPEAMKEINKILAEEHQDDEEEIEEKEEEKARKKEPSATQVRMQLERYTLGFPRVNPPFALTKKKRRETKTVFEVVSRGEATEEDNQMKNIYPLKGENHML